MDEVDSSVFTKLLQSEAFSLGDVLQVFFHRLKGAG